MSAKLIGRNAYAAILSAIPLSWLNSVRVGYQFAPPRSLKRKVAEIALRFLRYRRWDSSVSTFSPPGRPDIHFVNVESVIARRVFWLGQLGYEGDESRFWEYFCSRAEAIVEMGANIGMYTVLGAKAAGQTPYEAVDPHPSMARALISGLDRSNTSGKL